MALGVLVGACSCLNEFYARVELLFRNRDDLDLATTIQQSNIALKLFFTNHFAKARDQMQP